MSAERRCPNCGMLLGPDAPEGLCTRCVLEQVIEESEAEGPAPEENGNAFHLTGEEPGRYTGEREHARGGMGRILIAHDEQLNRDVVMKELLPECANGTKEAELPSPFQRSSPAVARFLREARVTGQLQHPAIVPVHELGRREDGTLYYTMKQVQGITLSDAIRQAAGLPERLELLPHFLDLCQAVSYAHSRGVIHRDIKPGNVMVGEFGETVLLDWGLAKVQGEEDLHGRFMERSVRALEPGKSTDAALSAFGQVLGTPVYMAPEQARGESDRVDERSDVYALGTVLYTLLTGRPPFAGERSDEILAKVINEDPRPVFEVERKAPRELAAICQRAMAKSPEKRYSSARELAEDLQRFMAGGRVGAYQYRILDRLARFARKYTAALVAATLALLALLAVAAYSYTRVLHEMDSTIEAQKDAEAQREVSDAARKRAELAEAQALEEKQAADAATDQALIARAQAERESYSRTIALAHARIQQGDLQGVEQMLLDTPEQLRGWEWGSLMSQCHPEEKIVRAHEEGNWCFDATRDGSVIVTAGQGNEAIVWDGDSFEKVGQFAFSHEVRLLALHPNGNLLVAMGDQIFTVLDLSSGLPVLEPYATLYSADRMQEFAMSLNVEGAPEIGCEGALFYKKEPDGWGMSLFRVQNGPQVIRFNILDEISSDGYAGTEYTGRIRFFRVDIPNNTYILYGTDDFEHLRSMKVEIDWIAITNDPEFVPNPDEDKEHALAPLGTTEEEHAIWTFDKDNEGWIAVGPGAVARHAEGKLILTYRPTEQVFDPWIQPRFVGEIGGHLFSPDGDRLYYRIGARRILALNTEDWKQLGVFPAAMTHKVCISPDGSALVTGADIFSALRIDPMEGNQYCLFDTSTFEQRWHIREMHDELRVGPGLRDISFDPSSQYLLCLLSGSIRLRDVAAGEVVQEWKSYEGTDSRSEHRKAVWTDPHHFIVADRQGTLTRYSTETGEKEFLLANASAIVGMVSTSDGRILVADRQGMLKSFLPGMLSQKDPAVSLETADSSESTAPTFSPNGKLLATWGRDLGWSFWDMETFERVHLPILVGEQFLGFRPGTGEIVLCEGDRQAIVRRELSTMRETGRIQLKGPLPPISIDGIAMDGTGRYVALSPLEHDGGTHLFDLAAGREIVLDWPHLTYRLALPSDGRFIAKGYQDEDRVEILSLPDCVLRRELIADGNDTSNGAGIRALAFHPTEQILGTGTRTGQILVWDVVSGELVRSIEAHEAIIRALCFSPDGARLISGGDDLRVKVWDWLTGPALLSIRPNNAIRGLAISPDGSMLTTAGLGPPVTVRVSWPRSAELFPKVQSRFACHKRLRMLDNAKLAWAADRNAPLDAQMAGVTALAAYLEEDTACIVCPSEGEYDLGSVIVHPSCSAHGRPLVGLQALVERFEASQGKDDYVARVMLARLLEVGREQARQLNQTAWRWAAVEERYYGPALQLARRAVELQPNNNGKYLHTMAYAEFCLGRLDASREDFLEAFAKGHSLSELGLAMTLATRGTAEDLNEACRILEQKVGRFSGHDVHVRKTLQTLRTAPTPQDPQLKQRIRALLSRLY